MEIDTPAGDEPQREIADLRLRLEEAEQALRAIREGGVDVLVASGAQGGRLFTLEGADRAYRAFLEEMTQGAITLGLDGVILYSNRRFAELVRTPSSKVVGAPVESFVTPTDVPIAQTSIQQGRSGRSEVEVRLQTAEGTRVPVLLSVSNLPDYEVPAVCLVVTDLTEHKRIARILESERLTRAILERTADAIIVCDPEGTVVHANPAAQRLCGTNPLRQALAAVLPLQANGKALWEPDPGPTRDLHQAEAVLTRADGEVRRVLVSVGPLSNGSPGPVGRVLSLTDITAHKQAEEALRAMHDELEARVQERTAELAHAYEAVQREVLERERVEARERGVVVEERTRIAHEIHDTLAQGFTGIVIQLEAAEDALADAPDVARAHLLRARALARESLAEARRSVWALRPLALETDGLAQALLHLVNRLAQESRTQIEFSLQGVPRSSGLEVEHHLLRIGQEALTNALRHAQAHRIRVTLTCHPEQVELSIEDDGRGLGPAGPPARRGFGLRTMQERAQRIGGQLTIASEPGQGTRVVAAAPIPYVPGASLGERKANHDPDRRRPPRRP
jgi:PAS domain S-box-containing protein